MKALGKPELPTWTVLPGQWSDSDSISEAGLASNPLILSSTSSNSIFVDAEDRLIKNPLSDVSTCRPRSSAHEVGQLQQFASKKSIGVNPDFTLLNRCVTSSRFQSVNVEEQGDHYKLNEASQILKTRTFDGVLLPTLRSLHGKGQRQVWRKASPAPSRSGSPLRTATVTPLPRELTLQEALTSAFNHNAKSLTHQPSPSRQSSISLHGAYEYEPIPDSVFRSQSPQTRPSEHRKLSAQSIVPTSAFRSFTEGGRRPVRCFEPQVAPMFIDTTSPVYPDPTALVDVRASFKDGFIKPREHETQPLPRVIREVPRTADFLDLMEEIFGAGDIHRGYSKPTIHKVLWNRKKRREDEGEKEIDDESGEEDGEDLTPILHQRPSSQMTKPTTDEKEPSTRRIFGPAGPLLLHTSSPLDMVRSLKTNSSVMPEKDLVSTDDMGESNSDIQEFLDPNLPSPADKHISTGIKLQNSAIPKPSRKRRLSQLGTISPIQEKSQRFKTVETHDRTLVKEAKIPADLGRSRQATKKAWKMFFSR